MIVIGMIVIYLIREGRLWDYEVFGRSISIKGGIFKCYCDALGYLPTDRD